MLANSSVAILVMRHPYTTYAAYVRGSLCADAAECLSLWSATWLFNLRQLEVMARNYAVVRSEGLTSLERARELVQLVQGHVASLPGRDRLLDEVEEKRLLASFTRSASGDALGYHPSDYGSSDAGNDDPWRSFDVNKTLTYAWARTPDGQAKVKDALSSDSEAAMQEWAGYSLTDPEGSSADGLLVYSSFVDSKDMERPKFAKAAEKQTAASRLLRTAAAQIRSKEESPPQGGSCAAQCEAETAKATEADADAEMICEEICQLKQLPVLGLANSVLAALGDVQVTIS